MKKLNKFYLFLLLVVILSVTLKAESNSSDKKTRSFNVKKGGKLIVNIVGGNIKVSTWQKDVVSVSVINEYREDNLNLLTFSQNNNTINIQSSSYKEEVNLEISVPSDFNLNLNTFGGNLLVDGNLTGNIKAKTSGGNIKIDKVKGDVNLITAGGDIKTKAINGNAELISAGGNFKIGFISGTAKISTAGGNIFLAGVKSKLNLSTAGGNIRVESVENDVTISTGGGNISIGGVGKNVEISTGGGNVQVDGAKESLTISTGAGNISVGDAKGWATLSTGAGNISLSLSSVGNNDTNVRTGAGNITLYLSPNADATVNAVVKLNQWMIENKYKKEWITSDFPSTTYIVDGDRKKIKAVYKLNRGKNKIYLRASIGRIEILKLKK